MPSSGILEARIRAKRRVLGEKQSEFAALADEARNPLQYLNDPPKFLRGTLPHRQNTKREGDLERQHFQSWGKS